MSKIELIGRAVTFWVFWVVDEETEVQRSQGPMAWLPGARTDTQQTAVRRAPLIPGFRHSILNIM